MKTVFVLIIFVVGISFSNISIQSGTNQICGDTTIVVDHGFAKFATTYRDGLKNGPEYHIYNNGADTIVVSNYKMGKLDGKSVEYYPGKRLRSVSYFKNDYVIGKWVDYDTTGQVIAETTFDSLYLYEDKRWSRKVVSFKAGKPIFTQVWTNGRRASVIIHDASLYAAYKATDISLGEKIYYEECSSCHSIQLEIIGPPLATAFKMRKHDWLIQFIRNGDSLYKGGDTIAKSLYVKYSYIEHPDLTFLISSDVEAVMQYVREKK